MQQHRSKLSKRPLIFTHMEIYANACKLLYFHKRVILRSKALPLKDKEEATERLSLSMTALLQKHVSIVRTLE